MADPHAAGIVLAGGRSSRMGSPKAALEWHGSTLLRRVVGIVGRGVDGPVVVVRAPGQELPPLPEGVEIVEDAPILDGVTRRLLLGLAGRSGEPVALRRPAPADLAGREVWLTSALHGIRAVTGWSGGTVAGDARCAEAWQVRLDALAEPQAVGALAQPRG
ncbi:MAG: molybdenum cofactor guanylyltransferase [Solirubrobacteraceae bacterium]|nr:molybdenum cofactor guanylyltransferase [Solirubrobacteraceae bacterium]